MKIQPVRDKVVIKLFEEEEKTSGGIIIPDTAREKSQKGRVEAVGTGRISKSGKKIPMNVKSGDIVLFGKNSGMVVKIDNEDYLIIREDDICGVLTYFKKRN